MKPYHRVTLWYSILGFLWIVATDSLISLLTRDVSALAYFQTVKGVLYVMISTALIYVLTRRAFERAQAEEAERRNIFNKTVNRVYHILLNYLNQMELVAMEAERSVDFDPETVQLARRISDEATAELMKLNTITEISAAEIDAVMARPSDKK